MKKQRPLKVVFVDDNDDFLNSWRDLFLNGAPTGYVKVQDNDRDQTRDAVCALNEARLKARTEGEIIVVPGAELFDNADIVFVDYDLLELEQTTSLTGEDIAYLLRCFSSCGVVILLNPPELGTNFFDLRLRRSFDSWADIVLGTDQLDNPWLWAAKPTGFAPWLWPNLPDAVSRRRRQIKEAERALDTNVLDLVGITPDARIAMDPTMGEPVTAAAKKEFYTIREFVLNSKYCLHRRDSKEAFSKDEKRMAQMGAARLSMWLEHVVLPAQTVLIDAPHLVSRLPGLLKGSPTKNASWNATCRRGDDSLEDAVQENVLRQFRLKSNSWLSRPAWFWPLLAGSPNYGEWASADSVPFVFCEDTSAFVERDSARRFVADLPSPAAFRFVEMPKILKGKRPDYRPSVRLSM